jgi:hypothetical protein
MKERTKNISGYGTLLLGGIALVIAMLAGNANRFDTNTEDYAASNLKHSLLTQQFAHELAKKNDARSLMVASILIGSGSALIPVSVQKTNEALAMQWMQSSIAAGQNDALIAWYEATNCYGNKACNASNAIGRLEKLDHGNAAVHLLALSYAKSNNDQAEVEAAFLRAANSRYYNGYFHEYAKATYVSMSDWRLEKSNAERADDAKNWGLGKPLRDEDYKKIQALGMAIAFPMPGFQSLTDYCDGTKNKLDRIEACIKILELMRNDNTAISKAIALSKLSKLTINHPKGPQFREELRQYYWVQENQGKLNKMRSEFDSSYVQQWPNLTEWDGLTADMQKAGIPLTARQNWLPDDKNKRSRVLTGLDSKN